MNIIVTGSRDHDNPQLIRDALDDLYAQYIKAGYYPTRFSVIQGGAKGADLHACQWVSDKTHAGNPGIDMRSYPANWSKYGPSAGPRRNIEMLTQYPDAIVLAFPQGVSKGTRNCIREAERRGMRVEIYESAKKSK